ncbi:hypothetical protein MSAN_01739600 [Mycena sanguinolenta]|uniref:Uncharacterized protein n=1 Tax=Mycena sanguinolenta TaxID=230812 RepID=A0A8H6XXP1_9AGAR|nr:hypothetical protein MSAN_01739600 [Mycena sanguinolenta]
MKETDLYSGPHIALIPGHILFTDPHFLHFISSNTLGDHWAWIIGTDGPAQFSLVSVTDIPKLRTFKASDAEQSFGEIYVHESPIRDDDYSVWIYGTSHRARRGALLSYRLSIPTSGDAQWCLRIQSMVQPDQEMEYFFETVTYCGHRLYSTLADPKQTIFSGALPVPSPRTVQVELAMRLIAGQQHVDIAPYSGALTYSTESSIVVQYYR